MSKVMQEHYLVVYQNFEDFFERLEYLKSQALDGNYLYKTKDRKLILKTEYGAQECYYFMCFSGDVDRFIEYIAGGQFVAPIYLEGDYPSRLINFVLSRCRGGVWEAEEI